jgi:hypothetical protein
VYKSSGYQNKNPGYSPPKNIFVYLPVIPLFGNNYCLQMIEIGVRGVVLGLSQDGACTNLFENFREQSLKRDLSNDTTFKPALFSLANTFKVQYWSRQQARFPIGDFR